MPPSLRWLLTTLRNYWLVVVVVLVVCVAAIYRTGYCFPQTDAHPDWPEFPRLKTRHLVVERIADFHSLYGHRYPPSSHYSFPGEVDAPRSPMSAVRVLGRRVSRNTFQASSSGYGRGEPQGFNQYGNYYVEVNLAGEKGYFKTDYVSYFPALYNIYQYNEPTVRQDTLFLRVDSEDYRLFIR
jgi:hypothetical protein